MASSQNGSATDNDGGRRAPKPPPKPNSVRAAPSRDEERLPGDVSPRPKGRSRQFVNAIAPTETPKRSPPSGRLRDTSTRNERAVEETRDVRRPPRDDRAMPEDVKRRFVAAGNVYYFPDGARAFADRGDRLTTRSENTEVIKSLVDIARARGWNDITVTGTQRFKQEMWFAARLAGLSVRGHAPDAFEEGRLVRALARAKQPVQDPPSQPAAARPREATAPQDEREREWVGRLIDHGPAPYKHLPHRAMSYFVKLETRSGEKEIWGVDLERAMRESLTRPQRGDEVALRRVRQDAVTVRSVERDAQGKVLSDKPLATHRNRWVIETQEFFNERAQAARTVRDDTIDAKRATEKYPELLGTYLKLHAAEIAARRFSDAQDQRRFVNLVRSALADSVARGDPLEPVRVRTNAPARESRPQRSEHTRTPEPVRGG